MQRVSEGRWIGLNLKRVELENTQQEYAQKNICVNLIELCEGFGLERISFLDYDEVDVRR